MYYFITNHISELEMIGQICLALILGAIIGMQRSARGRSAGLRTCALVCAGSCLFTILSITAFGNSNPALVAAQIVTGIGFLGAGTILHKDNRVEGLTTAAAMWIVAAIGMTVGVRYYLFAIIVGLLTFLVLIIDDRRLVKHPELELNEDIKIK